MEHPNIKTLVKLIEFKLKVYSWVAYNFKNTRARLESRSDDCQEYDILGEKRKWYSIFSTVYSFGKIFIYTTEDKITSVTIHGYGLPIQLQHVRDEITSYLGDIPVKVEYWENEPREVY